MLAALLNWKIRDKGAHESSVYLVILTLLVNFPLEAILWSSPKAIVYLRGTLFYLLDSKTDFWDNSDAKQDIKLKNDLHPPRLIEAIEDLMELC